MISRKEEMKASALLLALVLPHRIAHTARYTPHSRLASTSISSLLEAYA